MFLSMNTLSVIFTNFPENFRKSVDDRREFQSQFCQTVSLIHMCFPYINLNPQLSWDPVRRWSLLTANVTSYVRPLKKQSILQVFQLQWPFLPLSRYFFKQFSCDCSFIHNLSILKTFFTGSTEDGSPPNEALPARPFFPTPTRPGWSVSQPQGSQGQERVSSLKVCHGSLEGSKTHRENLC